MFWGWPITAFCVFITFFSSIGEAKSRTVKFKSDIIPLTAIADQDFSLDLRTLLSDQGTGNLEWSTGADKPAWVNLDSAGQKMTGRPSKSDAGLKSFRLGVKDGDTGALARIDMTVLIAPVWTENPLNLGVQKEDVAWQFDLRAKVTFAGAGNLTFSAAAGLPAWMTLAPNGILSGTPRRPHVGNYTGIILVVRTDAGAEARVDAFGRVDKTIKPPKWNANPITLENAAEDFPYSKDIAGMVNNPEGTSLSFKLTQGTASGWLKMSGTGALFGTPAKGDIGPVSVKAEVSTVIDGQTFKDETTLLFQVIHTNHAPSWTSDPVLLPQAITKKAYQQDLNPFTRDPDGDKLKFKLVSGPAWAKVSETGILSGTPDNNSIGTNIWAIEVSDGEFSPSANIHVVVVNRPPIWLVKPTVLPGAKEDAAYSQSLVAHASDPDGDNLTFTLVNGPNWATITPAGIISGTPKATNLGLNVFKVRVADGFSGADETDVRVTVEHVNHPPKWTQDPVGLPKATEKISYEAELSAFVTDPDQGDKLTFTKISGPQWAQVAVGGKLSGTPQRIDVGVNTFRIRVSDQTGASADATVTVTVEKVNQAPIWLQDPIQLGTLTEDTLFALDLAPLVKDNDGDALTFKKISGPTWLNVAADGKLSATPPKGALGDFSAVVEVSDGAAAAQATARGTVIIKNLPPVIKQNNLSFVVKERQIFSVSLNQSQYVEDPNGDGLTFTLVDVAEWVSLSDTGALNLKPLHKHIGKYALKFKVSDGKLTSDGVLNITVEKDPRPPIWLEDPIRFQAEEAKPFTADVAPKAQDLDGLALTFSKRSGPAWLTVAANGKLSGTPVTADIGENSFVINVRNDVLGADAKVIITVAAKPNRPPRWLQNPIALADATSETDYTFALAPLAVDDDGDSLTFKKISGPNWLFVEPATGKISGVPMPSDVGAYNAVFEVSDGRATAQANASGRALAKNHPPVIKDTALNFTVKERQVANINLNQVQYVEDLDGDALTFTLIDTAAWVQLTTVGGLTLKPLRPQVGDHSFRMKVSDGKLEAQGTIKIKVIEDNRPPIWTVDPISAPNAGVGVAYSYGISNFAMDPDGDALTFQKVSGPSWISLSSTGTLVGTPGQNDIGSITVTVQATDTKGASTGASVKITVDGKPNHPPKWLKDPIPLGDYTPGVAANFDLRPLVTDEDGDPLTFKKISGPGWLVVSQAGIISGTPAATDVGEFTATLEVSDGKLTAQANAFGKVTQGNQPPFIKPEALSFIVKERETFKININQPQYIVDPDGDALTFQLLTTPDWATLAANGDLELKPLFKHIGDHSIPMRVTDSKGKFAEGPIFVRVLRNPRPPVWLQDPIRIEAKVDQPITATLADKAKDLDSLTLSFSKLNGPDWLLISSTGALGGTPKAQNIGDNSFRVSVKNDLLSADATLIITVKSGAPNIDVIQIDKAVPGAPSENLWVVDNSWPWLEFNRLIRVLKEEIHHYHDTMNTAGVRHQGLYLSSDVIRWKGLPIQGDDSSIFLRWDDNHLLDHFVSRVNDTYNKKCSTSPMWSMHKFYEQAPGLSSIYHNGFFTAGVPMDVIIITKHSDAYRAFSKGTQFQNDVPDDYATRFIRFHEKEKQPYRISAIAADCQQLLDPTGEGGEQTAANNPYRTLVRRTGGQYFTWDCHFDMEKTLKEYARAVVFRAFVSAKRRIALSKTPSDVKAIQVFLAGKALPGNTGAPTDQWSYDVTKNEIQIEWQLIDFSTLKPGDLIEIKYPA